MFKKRSLYIIFIECLCIISFAYSGNLRFRQFSTKQGFPTKDVNLTRQSPDGFMWFGTYNGVIRYDGTDFKHYIHDVNDSTSIADNNISEMFIDSKGDLFIGGSGFMAKYNKSSDDFSTIKSDLIDDTFVNAIVETESGEIYVATYKGLNIYDRETGILTSLPIQIPIWDMYLKDSIIYLGTQYNGLVFFSPQEKKVIRSINAENSPNFSSTTNIIFDFDSDNKDNLWFSGNNGGLYSYSFTKDTLTKHDVYLDGKITTNNPYTIYVDPQGHIWITFINNGIIVYDPINNTWEHYTSEKPEKLSITSNSVRDIYEDRNGTIWLSTHFGGICYYNNSDKAVEYHYRQITTEKSIGHDIISSFAEDNHGELWVGTDGGGLFKYNGWNDFTRFSRNKGLNADAITGIVMDKEGDLWISQWQGGVQEFSPKAQKFEKSFNFAPESPINRGSEVKGIFCDSKNRIWFFPHYTPLVIYDQDKDKTYSIDNPSTLPPALFDIMYNITAAEDKDGNIWIASGSGLFRFSNIFSVEHFTNIPGDPSSFISGAALNVFCDSKNRIWITTPEGLELFDPTNSGFIHISEKYDFPDLFYGLIEDDEGKIWFSSQRGIGYFIPETMEIKYFDRNISVTGDDFISRSHYLMKDGSILFGSTSGYIKLDPKLLKPNTSAFPIAITELQLFNKPVHHKQENSILSKNIVTTDSIELHHEHSVISFKYSALYYTAKDKINYAYKLDGFDQDWNYVHNEKKATYTNLPPGIYTFKVKAQNIEGVWSNEKSIFIEVLPPWWNTWWFRTIYISGTILLVLGIYYNRLNYQKKLNKILSEKVKARTSELQSANENLAGKNEELQAQNETITFQRTQLNELNKTKDKFFSIIAHDLKNPMHTLLGFTDLLLARYDSLPEEKKIQFIEAISRSSKHLFALMVNLLDWARSQSKAIKISPKVLELKSVLYETIQPLKEKAKEKSIDINENIDETSLIYADTNMLETVIRNIISNALKFTPHKGTISISENITDRFVELSITDSGVGIPEDKIDSLFTVGENRSTDGTDNEKGTGLGLILCKEFIEQNGGKISASSKAGEGSTFTISIPTPPTEDEV